MPIVDCLVSCTPSHSVRAKQLQGMFDVPAQDKLSRHWKIDAKIEERPWAIGLIVGPSGAGKSQIANNLWEGLVDRPLQWGSAAVIDDFAKEQSIEDISRACQAVGFNTIPNWLRPFNTLSNGEQFRVSLARRILEGDGLVVIDEFTSVVDRQVAQIASYAVQKWVRKRHTQFVAVTCHYDVVDWLQPDWVIEPAKQSFDWRLLRPRPNLKISIEPVARKDYWETFAPFHYLSKEIHTAARCWLLRVDGVPAAFAGCLHRPKGGKHTKNKIPIKAVSRVVTLPDFQGFGLAFVLLDKIGSIYKRMGWRFRNYPAHPSFVRSSLRSNDWALIKKPGVIQQRSLSEAVKGGFGGRPCAVFEYTGKSSSVEEAKIAMSYWGK